MIGNLLTTDKYRDHGLLLLRVSIGALFVIYGAGKLAGGPETWTGVGAAAFSAFGFTLFPTFFGLVAAMTEFFGGIALIFGAATRAILPFLMATMVMAVTLKVSSQFGAATPDYTEAFYPFAMLMVFASLFLTGPGRFSLDAKFFGAAKAKSAEPASGLEPTLA